jgi:ArsR family transcriptional regulator
VKNRLERLITSSLCPAEDASKYIVELREIADKFVDKKTVKRQSQLFKALSDPLRLKILKLLALREMCVCEIMTAFNLTQPTASHHLEILERTGIVEGRREGKWTFFKLTNKKTAELIQEFDSKIR